MTPAVKRTLRRIAARCAEQRDYEALYAFVEAYDSRPRAPTPMERYENGERFAVEAQAYAALAAADEPLPWWRRLLARFGR